MSQNIDPYKDVEINGDSGKSDHNNSIHSSALIKNSSQSEDENEGKPAEVIEEDSIEIVDLALETGEIKNRNPNIVTETNDKNEAVNADILAVTATNYSVDDHKKSLQLPYSAREESIMIVDSNAQHIVF